MNTKTLQLLSQKHPAVEVVLFTENGHGKRGFLTFFLWNKDVAEQNNGTEDPKDNQEKHLKITHNNPPDRCCCRKSESYRPPPEHSLPKRLRRNAITSLKTIVAFYREIDKGLVKSLVFYAN